MENKFFEIIDSALNNTHINQKLARDFLSGSPTILRFVIGKNEQSEILIKTLIINGIIDDFEETHLLWMGIPIIKSDKIPNNSIVVNCSSSISPITVKRNLLGKGVNNILGYHELVYATDSFLPWPKFVEQMRLDYKENTNEWFKLYGLMSDEVSRNTLLDVLRYRMTCNPEYMSAYSVRFHQQYFEEFMNFKSEIFVDIGGYNGDTTEEFCTRYSDYKKVFLFEPSNENMTSAKKRLEPFLNIEFIISGLSNSPGTLSFDANAGSASSVTEEGCSNIDVTTLDLRITEPVTFIKMDIEGWELKALKGCRNHIINDFPKLAIAVYHNSNDFHEISNYILSLNPKYRLYIRHYTEGWSETVMYFVPLLS